jgi:hypothetical protein
MPKEFIDALMKQLGTANEKALGAMGVPTPPPAEGELTPEQKQEALRKALDARYGTKGGAERQKALADWIAAGNDPKDFPQGKSVGGGPPQATPTPAR